jgi:hypothetical protein
VKLTELQHIYIHTVISSHYRSTVRLLSDNLTKFHSHSPDIKFPKRVNKFNDSLQQYIRSTAEIHSIQFLHFRQQPHNTRRSRSFPLSSPISCFILHGPNISNRKTDEKLDNEKMNKSHLAPDMSRVNMLGGTCSANNRYDKCMQNMECEFEGRKYVGRSESNASYLFPWKLQ